MLIHIYIEVLHERTINETVVSTSHRKIEERAREDGSYVLCICQHDVAM